MKALSKLAIFALVSVFILAGCSGVTDNTGSGSGVDYTSVGSSTLRVNNASSDNLVLFQDTVSSSTLLGGVKGNAQDHGVNVSTSAGLFVLNCVVESDYIANKDNLANAKIAYSVLVYVDSQSATYQVSSGLVGSGYFLFNNNTPNYIEMRQDSWYGGVLTVLRPNENNKKLYVPTGDFLLFPVMKIERKDGATTIGLVEKQLAEYANSYRIDEGGELVNITADAASLEHVVAYITVNNQSTTGVRMTIGNEIQVDSLGHTVIGGNDDIEYTFDGTGNPGKPYSGIAFIDVFANTVATVSNCVFSNSMVYRININSDLSTSVDILGDYDTVYP